MMGKVHLAFFFIIVFHRSQSNQPSPFPYRINTRNFGSKLCGSLHREQSAEENTTIVLWRYMKAL